MRRRLAAILVSCVALASGCSFDSVSLEGKVCPCATGWVCDPAAGICVPPHALAGDGGSRLDAGDARLDAGGIDATPPPRDAGGPTDAATADVEAFDATAVDSSTVDSSVDAPPPPDPTSCDGLLAGALVCEDFEGDHDDWPVVVREAGTADLVSTPVYRGTGALHASTTVARGRGALQAQFPGVGSGELWYRAYTRIPSSADVNPFSFAYLFNATDLEGAAVGFHTDGRAWVWTRNGAGDGTVPVFARDRWQCLQLRVRISDSAGSLDVWVDGVHAVTVAGIDTLYGADYSRAITGLERAQDAGGAEVYLDEVAVGTSELPCD